MATDKVREAAPLDAESMRKKAYGTATHLFAKLIRLGIALRSHGLSLHSLKTGDLVAVVDHRWC